MKKVLVFGTFDGLHPGHMDFFKQARKYGEYLTVIVARDVTTKKIKKRFPLKNEKNRLKGVKSCRSVDEALLGSKTRPYKAIKIINPDVICLGYDQKAFTVNLALELKKIGLKTRVYRMKAYKPETYHSSILNKDK